MSGSDLPAQERGLRHAALDGLDVAAVAWAGRAGMPRGWRGEAGGQLGGFGVGDPGDGLAEVAATRRFDAVDAGAELDHVQVQLEDAALGERALELPGEDRLFDLAQ